MKREKLGEKEIDQKLAELEGWKCEDDHLIRRFEFENFLSALEFVNKVGVSAEKHDHHPDITFGWGYAEIRLTTHDTGGITDFDFAVAADISDF